LVIAFNASLGIPATLTAPGGSAPDLDRLVADALADPSVGGNPVPMTAENTRALFEACL
jgi:alcohol dehydrogenase class IV